MSNAVNQNTGSDCGSAFKLSTAPTGATGQRVELLVAQTHDKLASLDHLIQQCPKLKLVLEAIRRLSKQLKSFSSGQSNTIPLK